MNEEYLAKIEPIKISFIAPTGFGKTTATKLLSELYPGTVNIKLATPLYEIQRYIYNKIGVRMLGEQDGELLQFLGYKIQKEAPTYLAHEFEKLFIRVRLSANLITNDDCRAHNYLFLKNLGFRFVRINGYSRSRADHSKVDSCHTVENGLAELDCEYLLDNLLDIDTYKQNLRVLVERIKDDENHKTDFN